jgi:hypothetical protein
MRLASIYAQLESELKWRQDEIRFFQNLYTKSLSDEESLNQSRRSLILLLYAHFEGFVKFTLLIYINSVNSSNIACEKANSAIVAATLSHIFRDLRNDRGSSKNHRIFKKELPNDAPLHIYAKDREFVERTQEFNKLRVLIPDDVVDMESNLKPIVLKKNLYKLGFDYSEIDKIEGSIHQLLNYRNGIAHGSMKDGIEKKEYEDIANSTFKAISFVRDLVVQALRDKSYRKHKTP